MTTFIPRKMLPRLHAGVPLNDEDRIPWLNSLHAQIEDWYRRGEDAILTCSALKQNYRDILRGDLSQDAVKFVVLQAPKAVLADRVSHRPGHFMSPALLDSQLATLEDPRDALSCFGRTFAGGRCPADSGCFGAKICWLRWLLAGHGTKAVQASRYFRT